MMSPTSVTRSYFCCIRTDAQREPVDGVGASVRVNQPSIFLTRLSDVQAVQWSIRQICSGIGMLTIH